VSSRSVQQTKAVCHPVSLGPSALGAPGVDRVAGDQGPDRVRPGRAHPVLHAVELGDVLGGDLAGDAVA
jgi:hypothetical protein